MKTLAWTLFAFSMSACAVDQRDDATPGDDAVTADEQAIIGGTTDAGDPCVVAVFAHAPGATSGSLCTGTVTAAHTVLTAAHCVNPAIIGAGQVIEILSGTTLTLPGIVASSSTFDAAWDPANLFACHDFGVVHTTNPLPFPVCGLGATNLAAPAVRLVGYGSNTHTDTGAGTKRQVATNIIAANTVVFQDGNSNMQTCHGDSGGPAFQGAAVVGVTSFGQDMPPQVCFNGGFHCRVDGDLAFITPNNF